MTKGRPTTRWIYGSGAGDPGAPPPLPGLVQHSKLPSVRLLTPGDDPTPDVAARALRHVWRGPYPATGQDLDVGDHVVTPRVHSSGGPGGRPS